jgi:hypothetical protein
MTTEITTWVGDEVYCIARVTDYTPEEPDYRRGHPDRWEPGCAAEVEFDLVDANGEFTCDQLWAMASERDVNRITDELIDAIERDCKRDRDEARIDAWEARQADREAYA